VAEDPPESKPPAAPEGVFGNLPGTRPGTRSPRRRSGNGAAKPAESEKRQAAPPPPPPPPPAEPPPATEREAPMPADTGGRPRISSVEDLAWAGIAVAAQAATVGVRFASRALEAARKSADRD
jgi:hypothetical protein